MKYTIQIWTEVSRREQQQHEFESEEPLGDDEIREIIQSQSKLSFVVDKVEKTEPEYDWEGIEFLEGLPKEEIEEQKDV